MKLVSTACAGVLLGASAIATAAVPPTGAVNRPAFELADGSHVRPIRMVRYNRVPRQQLKAWAKLVTELGPAWQSSWDSATAVPSRIWGRGIHVPGATKDPAIAAEFAHQFLGRHLELLAPGATISDFAPAGNVLSGGVRSVGFLQYRDGLQVISGQVSFRFKNDRMFVIGSEALPNVTATQPHASLRRESVTRVARQWVLADAAVVATADRVQGPFILPVVGSSGVRDYRTVLRVTVQAQQPIGRWDVYVDANTGATIARTQTLMFAEATGLYNVPVRYPSGGYSAMPAQYARATIDGAAVTANVDGLFDWAGTASASATFSARGTYASVTSEAGDNATYAAMLSPDGNATWDGSDDEAVDAQLNSYIHANLIKEYVRSRFASDLAWVNGVIPITVNINEECNANSDGNALNFYRSSSNCENTGRLADVVYHEFGHSLHIQGIIDGVGGFEGGLAEGLGDYLAATYTNDSGMGRGFFRSSQALREIDPENSEAMWPQDVGEVHDTGLIIAGALWDMRKELVAKHGEELGVELSDRIYYESFRRAVDIPSMYVEALATDDDDGDLSNGTPNQCEINAAFERHGLRAISGSVTPLSAEVPQADGFHIAITITGLNTQCDGDNVTGARIEWELQEDPQNSGAVTMTGSDNSFEGVIPTAPEATVVSYRVLVDFSDGSTVSYPNNIADPMYEFFVGAVDEIYCTDFESDPADDGWTHGLTSGEASEGADDWQWGSPNGRGGDPSSAFSGSRAFGNDLGTDNFNGLYQSDKVNFALSPTIATGDYSAVRLQYWRWLTVEDTQYDQATIYANDQLAWRQTDPDNGSADANHHQDREWRFHDVDISDLVDNGEVAIKFELATDQALELGGWTIDDFCIVGYAKSVCGDKQVTGIENCDDGTDNSDTEPDACRTNCQPAGCGDTVLDTGEQCDDGNTADGDGCSATCQDESTTPPDGGPGVDDDESGGCGCRTSGDTPVGSGLLGLFVAGLLFRRRRRA